ncbi:hypothetical protein T12_7049 [Trichinella patagoniensis]|uniref:Integrase catalytic domain-containing protein n=1 Tax=Trichinella patagoniensis TaxID=990121 RepID=A0A0V1A9W7_9BILA|nr:hypothetical protein T12_7049 [Trichinella patagoniensis]
MELMDIPEIRIRRCLIPFMRKEIRRLVLHAFGDASKLAYGAAVYLVAIDKDGKRTANLVLAKAKVAPLKQVTLPRLELMAAFTAAKLIAFIKNNIGIRVDELNYWSDILVNVEENIELNPERFDDFEKLIRVIAYCRRFLANCRHAESNRRLEHLTLIELQIAENYWIRKAQREYENGSVRINGRLQNSTLPEMTKHPLILPDKHPLTRAIIRRCHLRQLHSGIETTLTMLQQRFWILRGRRNVKGMIEKCPCCRRVGSKPFVLKMAPLPADRIQPTGPFENTGLDLAGPMLIRNGKTVKKSYILIFTCMTTRAVHLEVASDMTVIRVMGAIRRFIARRGKTRILQSDNFRSFKQLDQELQLLLVKKMNDCLEKKLSAHRIQWKFITERAPWMGGYWERLIRSIKNSLHKVLQKALVDEEGLSTILCDIEARINARPLTYLIEDPKDPEVLTPYHFLTGTNFMDLPEVNPEDEEWVLRATTASELRKVWSYHQRLIALWWKRWKAEYIVALNKFQKWP